MLQQLYELFNCHLSISNQSSEETFLKLSMLWNGESDGRTLFTQYHMTSNNPVNSPSSFNKSLNSFLTRNDWEFYHSDHDFYNSSLLLELPQPLFGKRFETTDNSLLNVLQSLFDGFTLRMATRQGWAAYDVTTLLSFLNDDLELHDLEFTGNVDKDYLELGNNDPILFRVDFDSYIFSTLKIQHFHNFLSEIDPSRTFAINEYFTHSDVWFGHVRQYSTNFITLPYMVECGRKN